MTTHDTAQEPQALHQDLAADPARVIRDAFTRELLREVTDDDRGTATRLALMTRALVDKANGGDVAAIREVLDRTAGKALPGSTESETEPQTVTVEWLDRVS
jgi:hypothetical protein